ncbi:hypothetical protein EV201_2849 [Ancylomarina subtilis]|uniref:NADAR domain-containing protein n=1 Tax=Ancylomarina subtilis TaxID=1639035 RepID=A0A4Q7VAK2_9BACT|nr:NADAR family protein [Ancylomarina subtilis]RZT92373.1 hypothetical protein EV201_2849 [Ancylomarina subtilis]
MKKYSIRKYIKNECCCFSSTKKEFGGLSNMCAGYNLVINQTEILTSEALYQALRFSNYPEIQEEILAQKSPMSAKMVSKKHINNSRIDWEEIKVDIMRWCLKVKLSQNFHKFGLLLETTYPKPIIEISNKDAFWGAKKEINTDLIIGINALGRLLMELRSVYISEDKYSLLIVPPLDLTDFKLLGKQIGFIDSRERFIAQIVDNTNN